MLPYPVLVSLTQEKKCHTGSTYGGAISPDDTNHPANGKPPKKHKLISKCNNILTPRFPSRKLGRYHAHPPIDANEELSKGNFSLGLFLR